MVVGLVVAVIAWLSIAPWGVAERVSAVSDSVLIDDDFDEENGGVTSPETFAYTAWANWDVLDGSVDLVGNGHHDYQPGNGLYVDLDGWVSGTLASKRTFALAPGKYELGFDLAGSHRGDVNTVTVTLGDVYSEDFTLESIEPFRRIERTIEAASLTNARLVFDHAGEGDTYGLFLDNVRLASTELGVSAVSPAAGGNAGTVSVVVNGSGFEEGARVLLMDGSRVALEGRDSVVASRGRITSTFDLTALPAGPLALEVRSADGRSARAPEPFVVEQGGRPVLWADILGPPQIRFSIPQTYTVRVGNTGNVDAWGAHLFVQVPADVGYTWLGSDGSVGQGTDRLIQTVVAHVPARSSRSAPLVLQAQGVTLEVGVAVAEEGLLPGDQASLEVFRRFTDLAPSRLQARARVPLTDYSKARLNPYEEAATGYWAEFAVCDGRNCEQQWGIWVDGDIVWSLPPNPNKRPPDSGGPERVKWSELIKDKQPGQQFFSYGGFDVAHLGSFSPEPADKMPELLDGIRLRTDPNGQYWPKIDASAYCNPRPGQPCTELYPNGSFSCAELVVGLTWGVHPETDWPTGVPADSKDFIEFLNKRNGSDYMAPIIEWNDDRIPPAWREWFERVRRWLKINVVIAWDPNEKLGLVGSGPGGFVHRDQELAYEIDFENLATATAAAREVVITDRLDPAKLDVGSVALGRIAFGDSEHIPPPGSDAVATDIDLRPEHDLVVRVRAKLDPAGVLRWRLTAVDAETGEAPLDPLAGFLPTNTAPPAGEGSVSFTVLPRPGLPTGTEIRNQASIVFDVNAPIDTGVWRNTLDGSPPESRVQPLASTQTSTGFEVRWSGQDEGAGVRDYTIYVSQDDGPFVPWLLETPTTSAIFAGRDGHSYRFYSVATDRTSNVEEAPDAPDALTGVHAARGGDRRPGGGGDGSQHGDGGLTSADIRADLVRDLRTVARAVRRLGLRRVRRHRTIAHRFTPVTAGTLAVRWHAGRRTAARRRAVVIARGKASARVAGPLTVQTTFTGKGRTLIARSRRLPIVLRATLRPALGGAASATAKVTLGRQ